MVSEINNIGKSNFSEIAKLQTSKTSSDTNETLEPINSFNDEDQAIVSAEAKLLNELNKFNSGAGNDVELAAANVMAKVTVEAEASVIKAKKDSLDTLLDLGK